MFQFRTIVFLVLLTSVFVNGDYWSDRDDFIKAEESLAFGSDIQLTPDELKVNEILMDGKLQEYDAAFINPGSFLPANHFFHTKERIQQSKVFQFIQKLPKASLLHTHDTAMLSDEALFKLTYTDNLYACTVNTRIQLRFFKTPNQDCSWKLVSELRESDPSFNQLLTEQMTLVVDKPREVHTDINTVWSIFMEVFGTVTPLITYKPVFLNYFYQALEELYEDNVMYVEFRGTLPTVYDLDGQEYGPLEVIQMYKDVTALFKSEHSRFIDAKFIYAPIRFTNNQTVDDYVTIAKELIQKHSDFVVGFDLVGQEDLGEPLVSFISQLKEIQEATKLFFHAGETNWYGTSTDQNLIDAVLLGSQRIGHGYALSKHPSVLKWIKAKGTAIEISPISNQVLLLVEDLRNHPASMLFAANYPVVVCNDDPSFWGAKGLSYDWYMAYMGMASKSADLRFLKQLALNAVSYTALNDADKANALAKWTEDWNHFIQTVLFDSNDVLVRQV